MPYQPPEQKVQTVLALIQKLYMPMAQTLAAQSGQINMQSLTEMLAELLRVPRLRDVIQFSSPDAGSPPDLGPATPPSAPAQTSREYVRKSVATGGTPENRAIEKQQAWLDMARQPQQSGGMQPIQGS